jgi:hypothetical protein
VEEGEVVGGFAVASGCDSAFCFEPSVGAFDREAVAGERVGGFDVAFAAAGDLAGWGAGGDRVAGAAAFADPRLDLSFGELMADRGGVVAAVGADLDRLDAALGERVDQRDQVTLFVLVAGGESNLER